MCLEELHCEAFIDFMKCSDIPAKVQSITGLGAHAMIVTGGAASAYSRWHEVLRVGGTLIVVGLPPKGVFELGADPIFLSVYRSQLTGRTLTIYVLV